MSLAKLLNAVIKTNIFMLLLMSIIDKIVNGMLGVPRSIGDFFVKPYVSEVLLCFLFDKKVV